MTPQEIRTVVEQHVAAEARHDAAGAAATYHQDAYYEHVALGLRFTGRDAVAAQYASGFAAVPDSVATFEGEVVEGDRLVHWGRFRGTVRGTWLGQPPTGRVVDLPFIAVVEVRDGRMVGETVHYDLATLCDQAGYSLEAVRAAVAAVREAVAA
jgi:steroid delta-isomerase-like uncharacterized protein